jgi:serine/threonine protein kinase
MSQKSSRVKVPKIGGYEILRKVGKGGSGVVFQCRDAMTGRIVAVKVVGGEVAHHPVARMRFAQECKVARKLDHPNIVRVLDFGLDGAKPFLVMEYVDGESLGARIDREGRIPEDEAIDIIAQVGQALHWAHQRKIIHRDVKPDNVLVSADGRAKLTDLGLVKDLDADYKLTQAETFLGTPNFMAPEQFEDARSADAVSDVYSLAATLYMAVTGEVPFQGKSSRALATICKKKLSDDIAPPRRFAPSLSERVEAAMLRALRADRKARPATVLEFLEALRGPDCAANGSTDGPEKGSGRERRVKRRYSTKRPTTCRALQRALDESWEGQVSDISETGLRLVLGRRFEPDTLLMVVLESETIRRQSLVVRVRWVKPKGAKSWQMGCQLDQSLCDFEVNELR